MSAKTERTSSEERRRSALVEPFLFVVMESARLEAGGMRVSLLDVDRLRIGRGDARTVSKAHNRERTLLVPDSRMSGAHAEIVRRDGGFYLEDRGSTNGSTCNGESVTTARLDSGDVIELGQTLFVFREVRNEDGARAGDLAPTGSEPLVTLDPLLAPRLARLARVGASTLSVMLLGETGTGKEVTARALHQLSGRPGPFVPVNCGAIPPNLVESHLFGHVKGAFSGATRDEPGLVRAAQYGTLLLDEIGDLPPSSQAALLRVLQEGEVLPVGSTQRVRVDVRVLSATHHPLDELVEQGRFRRDLYARLAGYVFSLPPLRERKVDLGLLVATLLPRIFAEKAGELRLHRDAARALLRHDWPMNVRELEQCLRASSVLAESGLVTLRELPPSVLDGPESVPVARSPDEEALLRELTARLAETHGNVSEVARIMGKARQQVQRWLRRFAIDPATFK